MKETFEDLQLWRYASKIKIDKVAGSALMIIVEPGVGNRCWLAHGIIQGVTLGANRTFYATFHDGEATSQITQFLVSDDDLAAGERRSLLPVAAATANENIAQLSDIHTRVFAGTEHLRLDVAALAQNDEVTLFLRCYCRFKPTVTVTPDPAGVDATEINYYDEVYA